MASGQTQNSEGVKGRSALGYNDVSANRRTVAVFDHGIEHGNIRLRSRRLPCLTQRIDGAGQWLAVVAIVFKMMMSTLEIAPWVSGPVSWGEMIRWGDFVSDGRTVLWLWCSHRLL